MSRLCVVAGGTGGHIFPGLAVAKACEEQGVSVFWLGSYVGMEADLLKGQFAFSAIGTKPIRGKSWLTKLLAPWRIVMATCQAYQKIRAINPDVVLAMGGFVAGPAGLAAWLARKPLIVHEQNAVAGYTNRILARFAKTVFEAFAHAFPPQYKTRTVGNPVRAAIHAIPEPALRLANRTGPLRVLILGGSRGARAINETMLEVVQQMHSFDDAFTFWHQVGALDFEAIQAEYQKRNRSVRVVPFIDDMVEAYTWADVVICRAGAMTVSEVAAAGVAAIFIPFPYAVDDHQRFNAAYLTEVDAAEVIVQSELSAKKLTQRLQHFAEHRDRILAMAQRARARAKPAALQDVVSACLAMCHQATGSGTGKKKGGVKNDLG